MTVALFAFALTFAVLTAVWLGTEHWKAAGIDAVAAAVMAFLGIVRHRRLSHTTNDAVTTTKRGLRYLTFLGLGTILLGLAIGWAATRAGRGSGIPGHVVAALVVALGLYFLFSAVTYSRRKRNGTLILPNLEE
jgi:NhaP-type Na+/H+ or K+/H+ antiporter